MKCPKCDYLGFDTGARCKNCGYDFSLIAPAAAAPPAMTIDVDEATASEPRFWLDTLAAPVAKPAPKSPQPLPLFAPPGEDDDDEPLIRLPAVPRAPLAVRKTPDSPRARAMAKAPLPPEPVLQFADEGPPIELDLREAAPAIAAEPSTPVTAVRPDFAPAGATGRRLLAALIDHGILVGVDAAVLYFTLRMAGLPFADWRVLPAAPLLAFLGLLKFGYFSAFTAVGGQTIGKMAVGLRVVTDGNRPVDGTCAIRRTLAGSASLLFGLGFIPALVGPDHRALHDRFAHTRVVSR
jgi:uncharacterized RDD family membrane protein YckC